MTTEKTIRQAYESIGSMPQVGDIIDQKEPSTFEGLPAITWVDGWYFDTSTQGELGSLVHNASIRKIRKHWIITRNGKQIYPVLHSRGIASNVLQCLRDGNKKDAVDWIVQLIDAKIKEKMGE